MELLSLVGHVGTFPDTAPKPTIKRRELQNFFSQRDRQFTERRQVAVQHRKRRSRNLEQPLGPDENVYHIDRIAAGAERVAANRVWLHREGQIPAVAAASPIAAREPSPNGETK